MSSSALLPGQFISLYDMLEFKAGRFFNLALTLQILQNAMDKKPSDREMDDDSKDFLCKELEKAKEHCEGIGLPMTVLQIDRAIVNLQEKDIWLDFGSVSAHIKNIYLRIQDELGLQLFMHIPSENARYYLQPQKVLGQAVLDKFPSIINDVESSCRCYATGNYTAAVFHLMRIMECGLRVLGASLNDNSLDPKKNPTWESILRKCDDELRKKSNDRCHEWRGDEKFFSDATANLRAVKDAWRNPTMHIDQIYDSEQAVAVLNAVKGFMRHLATKLSE
ncbi:MAG: hypothetical protein AB7P24_15630 [Nitrospira sp.]